VPHAASRNVSSRTADVATAHEARMYDYWLGGKDHFAPDRALGDLIQQRIPTIRAMARANRAFLVRSVRWLAAEAGIRQFLDIGTGIPTTPNVHQVAQQVDRTARVLYVDKDPLVLAHARALMSGTPEGRTAFLLGDFLDADAVLDSPQLHRTIDLGRPVALLLIGMLMYFDAERDQDPYPIVRRLVDALPAGSHVALTHPTADFDPEPVAEVRVVSGQAGINFTPRSRSEVERFVEDLDVVSPGVVPMLSWRPDGPPPPDPHAAYYWAGVARKP
jgi:S-adenosyl methyltransferase